MILVPPDSGETKIIAMFTNCERDNQNKGRGALRKTLSTQILPSTTRINTITNTRPRPPPP